MADEKNPSIITVNRFAYRDGHTGAETEEVAAYRNQIYWSAVEELYVLEEAERLKKKGTFNVPIR